MNCEAASTWSLWFSGDNGEESEKSGNKSGEDAGIFTKLNKRHHGTKGVGWKKQISTYHLFKVHFIGLFLKYWKYIYKFT